MRRILLDGAKMRTRDALHDHLARRLRLPAYYGRNLDALHDCLGEMGDVAITLRRRDDMLQAMGDYGLQLLKVLGNATAEYPGLRFRATGR